MTVLADILKAQIAAEGPISLAAYMEACLLHPEHGYYITRDPLGALGDFITAPEISQMFGEMIGLSLAQAWLDQGQPRRFTLAELGPGRGTLMRDAMRATQSIPGFHAAAQVWLVEASPPLRAAQAQAVPKASFAGDLSELPDQPLFLIANEFFDALPIHQYRRVGQAWSERIVGLADGSLIFGAASPERLRALAPRLPDTKDSDIIELCPAAPALMGQIANRIAMHGGAALVVDYGDWRSLGDTFQAMKNHKPVDPLASPGQSDLTAHVDFAALSDACGSVLPSQMTPQGVFLERLGITARAQMLAKALSGPDLSAHISAHRRLTHPEEMGQLFKVIGIVAKGAPMLPGLEAARAAYDT